MLDNLIPIKGHNSVQQVDAGVFSADPLVEPQRFNKFLQALDFQKFQLLQHDSLSVRAKSTGNIEDIKRDTSDRGFRMSFFKDGKINEIIQAEPDKIRNQDVTRYSYTCVNYEGWEKFIENLINRFKVISKEDNPFISGVALHYANVFEWKSDEKMPLDKIFNQNELPPRFFSRQQVDFTFSTETFWDANHIVNDTLSLNISSEAKRIYILTQVVVEFSKMVKFHDALESEYLLRIFEDMHNEIKKGLKDLLLDDVRSKIGIV